jgi:hypothetical protein
MRQIEITILIGIVVSGMLLPFFGDALGAIQKGTLSTRYFFNTGEDISDYLWFVFVLEVFNLIPVMLCVICYKWCTILKECRYVPIVVVYIFIIYGHYEMAFDTDGLAGLMIIAAPIAAIPVFGVALVFSFLLSKWFYLSCLFLTFFSRLGLYDENGEPDYAEEDGKNLKL